MTDTKAVFTEDLARSAPMGLTQTDEDDDLARQMSGVSLQEPPRPPSFERSSQDNGPSRSSRTSSSALNPGASTFVPAPSGGPHISAAFQNNPSEAVHAPRPSAPSSANTGQNRARHEEDEEEVEYNEDENDDDLSDAESKIQTNPAPSMPNSSIHLPRRIARPGTPLPGFVAGPPPDAPEAELPMTPRNDVGPFIFDGSAGMGSAGAGAGAGADVQLGSLEDRVRGV